MKHDDLILVQVENALLTMLGLVVGLGLALFIHAMRYGAEVML